MTAGLGLAALAALAALTGCSSGHSTVAVGGTSAPSTASRPTTASTLPTAPTTVRGQMTTVPDCGTGAYEPPTLLIVCGDGTTTATDVTWSSWSDSAASGTGDVNLVTGGRSSTAPARLQLSEVVDGSGGPQFTVLDVTWTGTSPDGHPTDTFRLAAGSG